MQREEFQNLRLEIQKRYQGDGRSDALALAIVISELAFSALGLWLSLRFEAWTSFWALGQVIVALSILHWFVLLHDLGHECFFKTRALNEFFGHVSSAFVILPFYPWRYIHADHHIWVGWRDLDPTMSQIQPDSLPPTMKRAADFCWRWWIPVFALSFSFGNFWNIPKLFKIRKERAARRRFVWSCLFLLFLWIPIVAIWPMQVLQAYGMSYLLYLIVSDPLLLSQHAHIPQKVSNGSKVAPVPFYDQDAFTRSLLFPKWISKWILLYFDRHGVHHFFPNLPLYRLGDLKQHVRHEILWTEWLRAAKRLPAHRLLLESSAETGIIL